MKNCPWCEGESNHNVPAYVWFVQTDTCSGRYFWDEEDAKRYRAEFEREVGRHADLKKVKVF